MALTVVGVRHHSPACSRLVAWAIEKLRPKYVLIEGPSDMNERIAEFGLGHSLPVALFSYLQVREVVAAPAEDAHAHAHGDDHDGEKNEDKIPEHDQSRGTWCPFCDYSPEWVAMERARAVGATALFMDLPAWDKCFYGVENRYSDRHVKASDSLGEMAAKLGFEDTDALWDHMFEQPMSEEELSKKLDTYFEILRGDEPGGMRDEPREKWMAQYIAWAMADCKKDENVVAVCGGYHKPVLERDWKKAPTTQPELAPIKEGIRVGSYLVPYSFHRLDSFTGYASGMPSPAFYQAVWTQGPEKAPEAMLFEAIKHLRKKQQRVSPADAIAASTLAHGLKQMRGHDVLARIDVLDGLAGALVKDALEAPLPWTRRGVIQSKTDPMLVEMVAAFSGQRIGTLAPGTPKPPLVDDAFTELERVGVKLLYKATAKEKEKGLSVDLTDEKGRAKAHVLHRLRVLEIPGFKRARGPSFARGKTDLTEIWTAERLLETDTALIEAAIYGATLETASTAKLEERVRMAQNAAHLADALFEAALCGIKSLTGRLLTDVGAGISREPSLSILGEALSRLLALWHGEAMLDMSDSSELGHILEACYDRGLWLFEGVQGANAAYDDGQVKAVVAIRNTLRHGFGKIAVDPVRAALLCARRTKDKDAPPYIQGAALGFAWSTRHLCEEQVAVSEPEPPMSIAPKNDQEQDAIAALRAAGKPSVVGDFLAGLFALAREEVLRSQPLITAIDESMTEMGRDDFLIALPALRQAFTFFPPRERLTIAESVLELAGLEGADPTQLVKATVDAGIVAGAMKLEKRALHLARRFGLSKE